MTRISRESSGALFARRPPGAVARARAETILNLLLEILARRWPVGPANLVFSNVEASAPRWPTRFRSIALPLSSARFFSETARAESGARGP